MGGGRSGPHSRAAAGACESCRGSLVSCHTHSQRVTHGGSARSPLRGPFGPRTEAGFSACVSSRNPPGASASLLVPRTAPAGITSALVGSVAGYIAHYCTEHILSQRCIRRFLFPPRPGSLRGPWAQSRRGGEGRGAALSAGSHQLCQP